MSELGPDPLKIAKLAQQTMSALERRKRYNKISFLDEAYWYPSQLKFFETGSGDARVRLLAGGNRVGKTDTGAAEISWHASGDYPSFWRGRRFDKPPRIWVVGFSQGVVRDTLQRKLLGNIDDIGSGMVPLEYLAKRPIMYMGGTGACDTFFVTHRGLDGKVNGVSEISYKSFEQRRERLQGEGIQLAWLDERPPADVFSEVVARTLDTNGDVIVTYTPAGEDKDSIDYKFFETSSANRALVMIDPSEAKHIAETARESFESDLPEHERQARIWGMPAQGRGPMFDAAAISYASNNHVLLDEVAKDAKFVVGTDIGHFAAVLFAWSPQLRKGWVVDAITCPSGTILSEEVRRVHDMCQGLNAPAVLPHDANRRDPTTGKTWRDVYRASGLNVLAQHPVNQGGGLDPKIGFAVIQQLLAERRLVINKSCTELIQQLRLLHKNEKDEIVKERDHLCDALRNAVMMREHGKELDMIRGVGYGTGIFSRQQPQRQPQQYARNIDFPLWD
jgi:phage terminase large subunit-like protein